MASTFDLTINGVSRISSLQTGTLNIVKSFGRRATLTCEVFSVDGSWFPLMNQEVVWTVDGSPVFGGYIRELNFIGKKTQDNDSVFYQISCGDYSSLLEDRLVTETFPAGQTLKQWLTTLVTNWLSIKGISLDGAQVDGPTMSQDMQVDRQRADVVLQQMMLRSEYITSGGGITPSKTLLLFASGSSSAPFNLTSTNRKAIGDIEVSPLWNGQKYNRIIVKFGPAGVVEYFYQDTITISGTPTSFTLNYTPVGWFPVASGASWGYAYIDSSVNGRNTIATAPSPFGVGTYEYDPVTNSISKVGGGAFANGEVMTVPYDFRYPVEIIEEDGTAATNPIELLVIDESIRTIDEARLKAQRILAITITDTERVHYITAEDDLDVGQTQNINVPERFFNDDCVITDIRTRDMPVPTNDPTAVQFKLFHEVFATQGEQAKRTELDTVMQWSLLGSGSGAVAGTAPNSSGGSGVPAPPLYSLQSNRPLGSFFGEGYALYYTSFYDPTRSGIIFPEVAGDQSDANRMEFALLGGGDFSMDKFGPGSSILMNSDGDIFITAGTPSGVGAVEITGGDQSSSIGNDPSIGLIPGGFGLQFGHTRLNDLNVIEGVAGFYTKVTSLPYTINTTSSSDLNEYQTFFISAGSGTVNLPAIGSASAPNYRVFPNTAVGRMFYIKNIDATGTVTVDPSGSELIDTVSTLTLGPGAGAMIQREDAMWRVLLTTGGVTLGGGGGGGSSSSTMSAAGNDGDVQYNASGLLSGISSFNYDDAKGQLRLKHTGSNSLLELENTIGGTSVGGPVAIDIGGLVDSRINFGLDLLSGTYTARQVTPGGVVHAGSSSDQTIGFDLYTSQTVSAALNTSATRHFQLGSDGVAYVFATGNHLGTSAYGGGFYAGANSDNSTAAGWIGLENKSAIPHYIWPDADGLPRIGLSAPTADNAISDKSGTQIGLVRLVQKTSDESLSSTSALQDDDSLIFSIGANQTWDLRYNIANQGPVTADIKYAFNVPTGATGKWHLIGLATTAGSLSGDVVVYSSADLTDTGVATVGTGGTTAGQDATTQINLLIATSSTAGTVKLRWAQNVNNISATKVLAGSYIVGTRLG